MRIGSLGGFLAVVVLFAPAVAAAPSGAWRTSLDQASAEARASNKPLLVDFRADWCAPCKVMERDVYTDAFFAAVAPRLVPVQIDFDKQRALARKYRVEALPTIVFTDSYGTELFHFSGYIGPKTMEGLLAALPADIGEFNRLGQMLIAEPKNVDTLSSMGRGLRAAGLFLTSNEYYARALPRANRAAREAMLADTGRNYLDLKQGRDAASVFEKCLKDFPASPSIAEWTIALAEAYSVMEKPDRARQVLDAYLAAHPGTPDVEAARRRYQRLR